MTAQLLDGAAFAEAMKADLKARIATLRERGIVPGLGTILVGDDPSSVAYVRRKHLACAEVGIDSFNRELPADITMAELLDVIGEFNADPAVDGFLVQVPLPKHGQRSLPALHDGVAVPPPQRNPPATRAAISAAIRSPVHPR